MAETSKGLSTSVVFLVVANAVILGVAGYAYALNTLYPEFAYFSVQEDEYLEWATFWGFALAVFAYFSAAVNSRKEQGGIPWFLFGVGIFCFVVAMEEISWGQRVLGYRPPVYFLEENFQQEMNFHNVVDTSYRKLALKLVILAYGVLLPIAGVIQPIAMTLKRIGIVAPSIGLVPAFVAMFWIYNDYPWRFAGEWVEAMMAFGFLFAALEADRPKWITLQAAGLVAIIVVLGFATALFSHYQRETDPEVMKTAKAEIEALRHDFLSGKIRTRCNLHKRLYTFQEEFGQSYLQDGRFAGLKARGLPEERAEFLIDPWNTAYWLRDRCANDGRRQRIVFVYSFGPNRKRDSNHFEIRGDDVGAYIIENR